MSDTTKGLLYACLAFIGLLITITIFLIYTLAFRVRRQFVYNISVADSTTHPYDTGDQIVTESLATTEHPETTEIQGNKDDDKDTDSLTRNLSFRNFERPEQSVETAYQESVEVQVPPLHSENLEHPQSIENPDNADDDKVTDSLTRNLAFSNFERPEQSVETAYQESVEDQVPPLHSENLEHPQSIENPANADDGKVTGSLTRSLAFSNFERPEQSVETAYQESLEDQVPPLHSENLEHPQSIENPVDDDKVTDSLTRSLAFSNFEGPEQPGDSAHLESIENQATIERSEIIDHPQTSENQSTMDDDKDSDILNRGLSFSTFEKLIEYAGTTEISGSTEQPEITGYTATQRNVVTIDSLTHAGQPTGNGQSKVSGNLETITENFVGILSTDHTAGESKGPYSFNRGILINNHRQAEQLPATGHLMISKNLKTHGKAEKTEYEDTTNNNDAVSAISSSNTEKQVSFSGNDSTYIVERKEKTVQLIEFDESSNFEFVKFVKQQQKKT